MTTIKAFFIALKGFDKIDLTLLFMAAVVVIVGIIMIVASLDPNRPSVEQRRMNAINEQMRVCMANDYSRDECIRLFGEGR